LQRQGLAAGKYFLVSAHREENVDSAAALHDLLDSLNALAEKYDLPVLVSTHPRTAQRLAALDTSGISPRVVFSKPFGFLDYVQLQMHAFCILSDSGTITEEACLLNLPAVTIRNAHERPEGMDAGTLIMCGLRRDRVLDAVQTIVEQHSKDAPTVRTVADYDNPHVSRQVVRIVLSYVDYVNRTVWSK
jgi:UDP-N-acetylglucosamine 2-epimerase (non-hydrolysing)